LSGIPHSSGVRSFFSLLHSEQQLTRFSIASFPPLDMGMMWSTPSLLCLLPSSPQYAHLPPSLETTARTNGAGVTTRSCPRSPLSRFSRDSLWRIAASALDFALFPLCLSKFGKQSEPPSISNHFADCIASANPLQATNLSSHAGVTPLVFPSMVCLSAQDHSLCNFPTMTSSSMPRMLAMPITAGSSPRSIRILIQSPAIHAAPRWWWAPRTAARVAALRRRRRRRLRHANNRAERPKRKPGARIEAGGDVGGARLLRL
jgi:hypothetical protein